MADLGNVTVKLGVDDTQARQKLKGFFDDIDSQKVSDPLKGLNKSFDSVEKHAKQLGFTWDKTLKKFKNTSGATASFSHMRTVINAVNTTATKNNRTFKDTAKVFSLAAKGAKTIGGALSKTNAEVKRIGIEFWKTQGKTKGFVNEVRKGLGILQSVMRGVPEGVGMAFGNALISPIKLLASSIPMAVEEFRALDESIQLTLGIAGQLPQRFGELQRSILSVSSATAATAREVADVAQGLAKAGFSFEEIDAALLGVINGAEATGTAYETMGAIMVSTMGAWQLEAQESARVADVLTVAANSSNQSVSDLGEALKYVGPVAFATGQSVEDVSLALELLANSGIRGSQAGTSLKTILVNLQIASAGVGDEFTELSRGSGRLRKALSLIGAEMTDANGEMLQGKELIYALQNSMAGLSTGEQAYVSKALAGSEGLPAMNSLINAAASEVDALAEGLDKAAGTSAKQAAQALSGLSGSFKLLQSNTSSLLVTVGAVISKALKPLIDITTSVLSTFNSLPGPIRSITIALTLLGTVLGSVVLAMKLLKDTALATFAMESVQKIILFSKALTFQGVTVALAAARASVLALAASLKVQLLSSLGGTAQALKHATDSIIVFSTATKAQLAGVVSSVGKLLKSATHRGNAVEALAAGLNAHKASLFGIGKASTAGAVATGKFTKAMAASGTISASTATKMAAFGASTGGAAAAAGGAAAGIGGLLSGVGALAIALAPFAAVVGAVVLAVKYLQDRFESVAKVTKPLAASQDALNDSLKNNGKSWAEQVDVIKTVESGYTSWGKSLGEATGPADRFLRVLGPIWTLTKLIAEGLGRLNNWDRQNQMIIAVAQAHAGFQRSLSRSNKEIEENRSKMAKLNPQSEEYGRLLKRNKDLIDAQADSSRDRIKAISGAIKELEKDKNANKRSIEMLKKKRAELKANVVLIKTNQQMIREEASAYRKATGDTATFTQSLRDLARAKEETHQNTDNQALAGELRVRRELKDGIISEAEAHAISANMAVEAAERKLSATDKELAGLEKMKIEGRISQHQYEEAVKKATKGVKNAVDERIKLIDAAQKAEQAAINASLNAYGGYVNAVASNIGRLNSIIGSVQSIGSSGVEALKSLASSVTSYQLMQVDKVKSRQLENLSKTEAREIKQIETTAARRIAAIERSGASESARSAAIDRVNKTLEEQKESRAQAFEAKRKAAEEAAAARRKSIMREQLSFEMAALEAKMNIQKAQLVLWEMEKQHANDLAIQHNKMAVIKERAKGDRANPKLLKALEDEARILNANTQIIGMQADMKSEVLDIQMLSGKQAIANKALQEGLGSAFGGQVASVGELRTKLAGVESATKNMTNIAVRLREGLDPLPDEAEAVVAKTVERINRKLGEVDGKEIEKNFQALADQENIGSALADELISEMGLAGAAAGDAAATNIYDRFGDVIPSEYLKDELVKAMMDGSDIGLEEAKKRFDNLGEVIKKDQIAEIIGNSVGGGIEEGVSRMREIPVPEGMFRPITEQAKGSVADSREAIAAETKNLFVDLSNTIRETLGDVSNWTVGALKSLGNIDWFPAGDKIAIVAQSAEAIANSGMASELADANKKGAEPLKNNTAQLKSNIASAIRPAQTLRRELEKAAGAASRAARGRWAGGDVAGGQQYTVNEMGREMFMSRSGSLSEIRAPRFGQWVAPSSGTVVPAGVAQQIRENREANRASEAVSSLQGRPSPRLAASGGDGSGSGLQRALLKGLQGLSSGDGPVTNNVSITSERPVNDASKMLVELARLRAQRRR